MTRSGSSPRRPVRDRIDDEDWSNLLVDKQIDR